MDSNLNSNFKACEELKHLTISGNEDLTTVKSSLECSNTVNKSKLNHELAGPHNRVFQYSDSSDNGSCSNKAEERVVMIKSNSEVSTTKSLLARKNNLNEVFPEKFHELYKDTYPENQDIEELIKSRENDNIAEALRLDMDLNNSSISDSNHNHDLSNFIQMNSNDSFLEKSPVIKGKPVIQQSNAPIKSVCINKPYNLSHDATPKLEFTQSSLLKDPSSLDKENETLRAERTSKLLNLGNNVNSPGLSSDKFYSNQSTTFINNIKFTGSSTSKNLPSQQPSENYNNSLYVNGMKPNFNTPKESFHPQDSNLNKVNPSFNYYPTSYPLYQPNISNRQYINNPSIYDTNFPSYPHNQSNEHSYQPFNNNFNGLYNANVYNSSGQVNSGFNFINQQMQPQLSTPLLQSSNYVSNLGGNKTHSFTAKNTPFNTNGSMQNFNYSTAYSSSNSGSVPNLQGYQPNGTNVLNPLQNKSLFYNSSVTNTIVPQIPYPFLLNTTPSHIIQNPNYLERLEDKGQSGCIKLVQKTKKSGKNKETKKKCYLSQNLNYNESMEIDNKIKSNKKGNSSKPLFNDINLTHQVNSDSIKNTQKNANTNCLAREYDSESDSFSNDNQDEDNEDFDHDSQHQSSCKVHQKRKNSNNDVILDNLKTKALKQIKLLDISSIMNSERESNDNEFGNYDEDDCGNFTRRNPKDLHLEQKSSIKINFKNYEFFSTSTSKDLYNSITTKLGSKLAQDYIGSCPDNEVDAFYEKIKEYLFDLIENKYSNFFFQKLIYSLYQDLRLQFIHHISKNIIYMSNHKLGNRSIQALIYSVDSQKEEKIVLSLLEDKFEKLAFNKFGSFVLSTILQTFSDESVSTIIKLLNSKFLSLITNEFALYLIKSYVSKARESKKLRKKVMNAMTENFIPIIKSKHGYYGILYVLDNWGIENCQKIIGMVETNFEIILGTNLYNLLKRIFRTPNQVS